MKDGYIKLSRKFFTSIIWKTARTFNESEAWIDLIQSARFEPSETMSRVGGREITYGRGQYPASIRFLSTKWKWSERKVRSFLKSLQKQSMIEYSCSQGMNLITLVNYDKYNPLSDTANDTASDTLNSLTKKELCEIVTQQVTQRLTQQEEKRHSSDTKNNKEKNNNKETIPKGIAKKDELSLSHPQKTKVLEKKLYDELIPFVPTYGAEMIRAFYDYWTEPNKSKTNVRYNLEKTWDTKRRLSTWSKRDYGNRKTDTTSQDRARSAANLIQRLSEENELEK